MDTNKQEFLHLQHSEEVVAKMAATIFGSLIQGTPLHNSNEEELIDKSISIAIKMAIRVEKTVKSSSESNKTDSGSAYLV